MRDRPDVTVGIFSPPLLSFRSLEEKEAKNALGNRQFRSNPDFYDVSQPIGTYFCRAQEAGICINRISISGIFIGAPACIRETAAFGVAKGGISDIGLSLTKGQKKLHW